MTDISRGSTVTPEPAADEPATPEQPRWQDLEDLLGRHLSPISVQGLFARIGGAGAPTAVLTQTEITELMPQLESALRLFTKPLLLPTALRELEAFAKRGVVTEGIVPIAQERDVGEARARTRMLCDHAGARPFATQRAVTIVSELARNIFKYAARGRVELSVAERRLHIVAFDNGPGIPHLDEVLAGRYKSRTGLGKGLTGVRRLADSFDAQTGPTGTRVEAVVDLRG
jgi:serine/threonine-protein kinase RsbT